MFYPDEKEFIKLSKKGNLIPVYKEIVTDLETPVSAFKKIESEYSFLLESIEGGEKIARYSFLGTCQKSRVTSPESFEEIRKFLKQYRAVPVPGLPRFYGGLVGYVSYDAVRLIEDIPDKNPDELKLPLMQFMLADTVLAFDHIKHKILIIANAHVAGDPKKAYKLACKRIREMEKKLNRRLGAESEELAVPSVSFAKFKAKSNVTQAEYEAMVRKAKKYINAGDVIQVVPSQRFTTELAAEPFDVYRRLRVFNPSPYMYYLKLGPVKIIGSSPEVMVRLEKGQATVRPIAGTRPRGKSDEEDKKLMLELLASKKERAEHVMLVDLGRNDLGRVCDFGSVKVTEEMVIEKYSHVMHIVSNVTGKLRRNMDAVDLIKATFPAGTVSGAPKVRAMEIIDELENVKRGLYAGSVGYFSFSGDLDTGIAIRTILVRGKKAYIQAGGGVVADSDPGKEYQETVNKARALIAAAEL
jgi:anthranilate synthase component 1